MQANASLPRLFNLALRWISFFPYLVPRKKCKSQGAACNLPYKPMGSLHECRRAIAIAIQNEWQIRADNRKTHLAIAVFVNQMLTLRLPHSIAIFEGLGADWASFFHIDRILQCRRLQDCLQIGRIGLFFNREMYPLMGVAEDGGFAQENADSRRRVCGRGWHTWTR